MTENAAVIPLTPKARNGGPKALYELGEIPPLGHLPEKMYAWAIRKDSPKLKEVVGRGIVSSLQPDNARVGCRVEGPEPLPACRVRHARGGRWPSCDSARRRP